MGSQVSGTVSCLCQLTSIEPQFNSSFCSFLADFKIPYTEQSSTKELVDKAAAQWDMFTKPYTQWSTDDLKVWVQKNVKDSEDKIKGSKDNLVAGVESVWDETSDKATEAYEDVTVWMFKYFSTDELRKLLGVDSAKKKVEESHAELVKEIQDKYKSAKQYGQSFYPDDSLFENLSTKDLKQILKDHGISVPNKSTATATYQELLSTLRRNLRYIYLQGEKQVVETGDKLGFEKRKFFDKAGHLKKDVFADWSESDLKLWLNQHELLPKSKSKFSRTLSRDDLVKLAQDNVESLKSDIESYLTYKEAHASPILDKTSDTISDAYKKVADQVDDSYKKAAGSFKDTYKKAAGSVDDTYKKVTDSVDFSAFSNWPEPRLKDFLASRGIQLPKQLTPAEPSYKDQLVALVEKHKNKAVGTRTFGTWSFDHWSVDDLTGWLQKQGQVVQGTRDDLLQAAQDYISKLHKNQNNRNQNVLNKLSKEYESYKQAAFDKWTDADLASYLKSFGFKGHETWPHEELARKAREQFELFQTGVTETTSAGQEKAEKVVNDAKSVSSSVWSSIMSMGNQVSSFFSRIYGALFGVA